MMTQEQYIASRAPIVHVLAILAIFLGLGIAITIATGDDSGILGMLFYGAQIVVCVLGAAMAKKRWVVVAAVVGGLLFVPGAINVIILVRLLFSHNVDRGIGEMPKWWLTTGMISTCAVYVPLVAIGILGWRNYIRAHRRNT